MPLQHQANITATIGATRFELATSRSRTVRSIQAELRPVNACSNDLSDPQGSVNSTTGSQCRDRRATRTILRPAVDLRETTDLVEFGQSRRLSPLKPLAIEMDAPIHSTVRIKRTVRKRPFLRLRAIVRMTTIETVHSGPPNRHT